MKAAVSIELDGARFALDEGAFLALRAYLDRAAARLGLHPDRDEVIAGLERSIAAKLARRPAAQQGATIDAAEMTGALKEVGRVDGPSLNDTASRGSANFGRFGSRRLYRLREGQQIAGVCTGLAAFAEVDVGIIRLIFILGAVFSGGVLAAVYIVLMFVMPVAHTEPEIADSRGGAADPGA
jgi:phage shock protein PspC (stress-responsive transcriptional regulator)